RRHTRSKRDWSSDVCSSDLLFAKPDAGLGHHADEMIELFRLKHVAHLPAGSLSYGQQKLIDIAMAFMPTPRLVLLDEPCAGVNRSEERRVGKECRSRRGRDH